MIKNLNDLLTFIVLIVIVLLSLELLFYSFYKNNSKGDFSYFLNSLKNYSDNEEE